MLLDRLEKAERRADELGHELERWRSAGDRAGTRCARCGARIYVAIPEEGERILEGEALEERCGGA
jgi:tRNA(Ile2) C34 agmatinyltransferase TiaS